MPAPGRPEDDRPDAAPLSRAWPTRRNAASSTRRPIRRTGPNSPTTRWNATSPADSPISSSSRPGSSRTSRRWRPGPHPRWRSSAPWRTGPRRTSPRSSGSSTTGTSAGWTPSGSITTSAASAPNADACCATSWPPSRRSCSSTRTPCPRGLELIEDSLADQVEHDACSSGSPRSATAGRKSEFAGLDTQASGLLKRQKAALTGLVTRASQTLEQVTRRRRVLEEEYGFIRTHIFWVRDQEPIGLATASPGRARAQAPGQGLIKLAEEAGNPAFWGGHLSSEFLTAAAAAVVLPLGLFRAPPHAPPPDDPRAAPQPPPRRSRRARAGRHVGRGQDGLNAARRAACGPPPPVAGRRRVSWCLTRGEVRT